MAAPNNLHSYAIQARLPPVSEPHLHLRPPAHAPTPRRILKVDPKMFEAQHAESTLIFRHARNVSRSVVSFATDGGFSATPPVYHHMAGPGQPLPPPTPRPTRRLEFIGDSISAVFLTRALID